MAKTAAKPKEDDKKTAAPAATPAAEGAAAAPAAPAAPADPAANAEQPAAPAAPLDQPPADQLAPEQPAAAEDVGQILVVDSLSPAFMDVLTERRRQVAEEGYSPESDAELTDYQLPRAAACYVLAASGVARHKVTLFWPFAQPMKVAEQRRRNLIKAAALILAELERLDREAEQG